jgi:hypothetical protein
MAYISHVLLLLFVLDSEYGIIRHGKNETMPNIYIISQEEVTETEFY